MLAQYKKSIFTIILGDVFIWYDFAIFGYLAPIIGQVFFPSSEPKVALVKAFLLFGAGFLLRPLGGIILGNIGDKYGRKKALIISFLAMAIPSAVIGLLPVYAKIGWSSTLILVTLRIIQGLSCGGELSSASSYTYEVAPARRGFWCSWNSTASVFGVFSGSLVVMLLTCLFSHEDLINFGWRLAFLLGALLIIPSILAIRFLPESHKFRKVSRNKELEKIPVLYALKNHWQSMLAILLANVLQAVSFYVMVVWMPSFANVFLNKPLAHTTTINTFAMLVLIVLMPFAGYLSDKIGYVKLAVISVVAQLVLFIPLFYLVINGGEFALLLSQLFFISAYCGMAATTSVIMAFLFPVKARCSGVALSYNMAASLFGGTAPAICTFLINATKMNIAPAFYLIFCALLALVGYLLVIRLKRKSEALDEIPDPNIFSCDLAE